MEIPNVNENEIIEMIVKCDKKEFKLKVVNVNSLSDDLRSNIMKNYNYKGKIVLFRNEIFAQNAIELYRKILELPDDENWEKAYCNLASRVSRLRIVKCEVCNQSTTTINLNNHIKTKKHLENERALSN